MVGTCTTYALSHNVSRSGCRLVKKARGGETEAWYQCIKCLTVGLNHVGRCRLGGLVLRDKRNQWLETVCEMAENRCQLGADVYIHYPHLNDTIPNVTIF
ncbi:unnamed protein product [Heterobilharzia americana]|nr:unnamed protein product [Heterobilharzia americana]